MSTPGNPGNTSENIIAYNIVQFVGSFKWTDDTRVMLDLVPLLTCTFCNDGNGFNQSRIDAGMVSIIELINGLSSNTTGNKSWKRKLVLLHRTPFSWLPVLVEASGPPETPRCFCPLTTDTMVTQRREFLFAGEDSELIGAFWPFHGIQEERKKLVFLDHTASIGQPLYNPPCNYHWP